MSYIIKSHIYRFQFLNHRCVSGEECISTNLPEEILEERFSTDQHSQPVKFFIFNNTCTDHCSAGFELNSAANGCQPCKDGKCTKWCLGSNIDNIAAVQTLHGCTHIQGSLEISIKAGKPKIVAQELDENLGTIEEIEGCLKITRSSPVINLQFLKNLRTIHGVNCDSNSSLHVMENQNLQELWDWESKQDLKIVKGRLFFHFNPKLCLHHIHRLIDIVHQKNVTNLEVSRESNGYKIPCNASLDISISVVQKHYNSIQIHIPYIKVDSLHFFLRFEVHYIKDPGGNISIFDDFDQCSDYGWKIKDVSLDMDDDKFLASGIDVILTNLEPYMQYAYYVNVYTLDQIVGTSLLQNTNTLSSKPTELISVLAMSNSSSEITIQWEPPKNVNGKLKEYVVTWTLLEEDESLIYLRDYCEDPMTYLLEPVHIKPSLLKKSPNSTCCLKKPTETPKPKDGFESLCSNHYNSNSPIGFPEIEPDQTCESYFNKYISITISKQVLDVEEETLPKKIQEHTFNKSKSYSKKLDTNLNEKRLSAVVNSCTISNLKNYHNYVVTIKACREQDPEETDNSEENRCSKIDIVNVRTQKDINTDSIANGLIIDVVNKTLFVSWKPPLHPNGILVGFEFEYRQRDVLNPKSITYCISYLEYKNNKQTYTVMDILPGKYECRIRAVSFAGKGPYTQFQSFVVTKGFAASEHVIITLLVLFIVTILVMSILTLKILQKRKISLDDILVASVNPEYECSWDQWELRKEDIEVVKQIGQGTFGKVFEGILRPSNIPCAVKSVSDNMDAFEKNVFINEASIMKSVSDAYFIVQLLGVVAKEKPPLVVMELMEFGDLRSYLISVRNTNPPKEITKLRMAAQIADGMSFMEAKKFVHRDLAARNCMVNCNLIVKVGDFGMTRDIYETDYYRKSDKGLLPIRWMAPESLKDGLFTTQSDVWSYGVVLWEIVTLGSQPYQGLSNEEVLREVMANRLSLDVPPKCASVLKTIMMSCWKSRPDKRSNFMDTVGLLEYCTDEQFKKVSFYHSEEAVGIRTLHSDYVEMWSLEDSIASNRERLSLLPSSPPSSHTFSLKLATLLEDSDVSEEDSLLY